MRGLIVVFIILFLHWSLQRGLPYGVELLLTKLDLRRTVLSSVVLFQRQMVGLIQRAETIAEVLIKWVFRGRVADRAPIL